MGVGKKTTKKTKVRKIPRVVAVTSKGRATPKRARPKKKARARVRQLLRGKKKKEALQIVNSLLDQAITAIQPIQGTIQKSLLLVTVPKSVPKVTS